MTQPRFILSGYWPALIVPYQQLVDRFPFLGDGADRAEDIQPLDMEAVVQIIEEKVLRGFFSQGSGLESIHLLLPISLQNSARRIWFQYSCPLYGKKERS
ncbi:hypothetical protein [Bacteroides gallinarum]|uniref:hypothetical protein n=1 Tax=Bacteroides gallinarum TaxID=376806 RepID=UPI000468E633|nr:hypothetical protein [Bacteroides gallinarum]